MTESVRVIVRTDVGCPGACLSANEQIYMASKEDQQRRLMVMMMSSYVSKHLCIVVWGNISVIAIVVISQSYKSCY